MSNNSPIAVSIITGFLGSGKTTLLNSLLKHEDMGETAVIINEFGDVGIDHLLVEKADDNIFEMASGCLCCTIRGDLVDTLSDLVERRDRGEITAFNRVVIETTGLADPAPVLHTIMNDQYLLSRYRLEGVITVFDAVNGEATLDAHDEAVKQVAVADRIVLSKTDLLTGKAGEDKLFSIIPRLKKLCPGARMIDASYKEAVPANLFNTGLYDPATKTANVKAWLAADAYRNDQGQRYHHHDPNRHDDHISSFSISSNRPISPAGFELFLDLLRSYHGPNLLRLKGIVKLEDDETRPLIIHAVQHIFHPPHRLAAWPDDDHTSRLVFITRDIARTELDQLFKAFTDPVRGGADAFADDTLSLHRGD